MPHRSVVPARQVWRVWRRMDKDEPWYWFAILPAKDKRQAIETAARYADVYGYQLKATPE